MAIWPRWRRLRAKLLALRGQAVTHIFFVMLIATLGVAVVGIYGYGLFNEREIDQRYAGLTSYYGDQLGRAEFVWKSDAVQLRSQLEFVRLLEQQDSRRWHKLTAFLNAQRIFVEFPTLLVLNGAGEALFRYGAIAHTLNPQELQAVIGISRPAWVSCTGYSVNRSGWAPRVRGP
jgi:hypothetical protein